MLDQTMSRRVLLSGSAATGAVALFMDPTALAARSPSMPDSVRPYRVHVPEAGITDLRRRIRDTRWPDKETAADRAQGTQLANMQGLLRYWGGEYDWRRAEARLYRLPQFSTTIDGLEIHFIHVRSRHPKALPVLISHGWPGSVF